MWFYHLMMTMSFLWTVSGQLVVYPVNEVTTVGGEITFHFRTDLPLRSPDWFHTPVNRVLPSKVFANPGSRWLKNSTASCDYYFTIKSIVSEDAGLYAWYDGDDGLAYGVELVVMRAYPTCETDIAPDGVVEGETIEHVCRFSFRGTLLPVTRWITGFGERNATCNQQPNEEHICRTRTVVNSSHVLISTTFQLNFLAKTKDPQQFAVNNLTSVFNWTSPERELLFPVWRVRANITGSPADMYVGQSISCSAEANPPAAFIWQLLNSTSGLVINVTFSRDLSLDSIGRMTFRCLAENSFRNKRHANYSAWITINIRPSNITKPAQTEIRTSKHGISDITSGLDRRTQTFLSENESLELQFQVTDSHHHQNLPYEKILLVSTVAFAFLFITTLISCSVRVACQRIRKKSVPPPVPSVPSEGYYLTLKGSDNQYPTRFPSPQPRSIFVEYEEEKEEGEEDFYERIDDNQVIASEDELWAKKRPHGKDASHIKMDKIVNQNPYLEILDETSLGDRTRDFGGIESTYITCPGALQII